MKTTKFKCKTKRERVVEICELLKKKTILSPERVLKIFNIMKGNKFESDVKNRR